MPPTKRLRSVSRTGAPAIAPPDGPVPEDPTFETTMSTAQAYRGQPAKRFVADLAQRIALAGDLAERLETALHEAVANAIIHGNLGLSSPRQDDLDRCVAQEAVIARLLERPDLSRRTVTISARWTASEIELAVQDEGHGYSEPPETPAEQGRGLFIIRTIADHVATGDDGRRLAMRFAR
jgi:anti-sigma regulatory factor (Ser/Thr protein kinase)